MSAEADDPAPDAQQLDSPVGYTLLRTEKNGRIELSTDGEQLLAEVETKQDRLEI